ncbi:(2Fe-2S)-binding protein [Planococcus sp. CP5-4]|uniref:(2Fe-2S)-binding protein n=1 Tax=unclassified Planococcus (in: firmicutes) TaxID=2662419 RepID=UPI001C21E6E7|nr:MULTISPECIES: (2Fe-2S)-binding protein [unclassified Planococcus (in: firmicutes)]MBU9671806.1 (2Fe-2S)-binding protein [Planococcus sp. CP5-4_YE]MBV0909126.1 (2Fe-2S)-binding protein [Planococcus sp. CP5-4_UN]MBW6063618.1 (2Fe-2S)-binding protein [Planococcus sp. CP5-4]
MLCRLAAEESAYLSEHFRLLERVENEEKILLSQLKDPIFLQSYLTRLQQELETESRIAAASQLIKRLGYLMIVPSLYTAAAYNKLLNLDFSKAYLVDRRQENLWIPHLFWGDLSAVKLSDESRLIEFEAFVEKLFQELSKIIHIISRHTPVPKSILWENTSIYVYWLYENRLMLEEDENVRLQAQSDFEFLLQDLPAGVFHEKVNQLQKFHHPKKIDPESGEAVRPRQTCCFAYETGGGKAYCKTCPKKFRP